MKHHDDTHPSADIVLLPLWAACLLGLSTLNPLSEGQDTLEASATVAQQSAQQTALPSPLAAGTIDASTHALAIKPATDH